MNHDGEISIGTTPKGAVDVFIRTVGGTVWLSQKGMAELFATTTQNISIHIQKIFREGELVRENVTRQSASLASDGKRYFIIQYNLDVIVSVGFRIRTPKGIAFRRWTTHASSEFLIKGFAMNDCRLKEVDDCPDFNGIT